MRILGLTAAAALATACAFSAASAQTTGGYNYEWTPPYSTGTTVAPATGSTTTQQTAPVYTTPATTFPAPTTTYPAPATTYPAPTTTYPAPAPTYPTTTYPAPTTTYPAPTTTYPAPAPTFPAPTTTFPTYPTYPTVPGTVPANPNPITRPGRGVIEDTDSWTFNLPRYYPAIQACLRNVTMQNPVIANIQERGDRTVMLVGKGGSSDYKVCRTGLRGTRVSPDEQTRNLPPAFYAPVGTSFTIAPDRPIQPVVSTDQRLLGWLVRTQPPSPFAQQFGGSSGQAIEPVTVNAGN